MIDASPGENRAYVSGAKPPCGFVAEGSSVGAIAVAPALNSHLRWPNAEPDFSSQAPLGM